MGLFLIKSKLALQSLKGWCVLFCLSVFVLKKREYGSYGLIFVTYYIFRIKARNNDPASFNHERVLKLEINSLAGSFLLLSSPFPSSTRVGGVPPTAIKCLFKTLPVFLTHNWGHSNVKFHPPGCKMWRMCLAGLLWRIEFSFQQTLF